MKTQALKGMRDLLPNEQTLRDYIQGKILETYRASGFERISTPCLLYTSSCTYTPAGTQAAHAPSSLSQPNCSQTWSGHWLS